MLQRLQTFKQEQSFNADNGIDYIGVFNKRSLLKPQIETIINDYVEYFQQIDYVINEISNDSLSITLNVFLFNGDVATHTLVV